MSNESEARLAHDKRNGGSDSRMCWGPVEENQTRMNLKVKR